jgi:hypothetical protein
MELEAQTQAEAGQQAEGRDDAASPATVSQDRLTAHQASFSPHGSGF